MDLGKTAKDLLKNSPQGEKIREKQPEIEKLVSSSDGEKVKKMLSDRGNLQEALEKGDTQALTNTVRDILSTKEGARRAKHLEELFK